MQTQNEKNTTTSKLPVENKQVDLSAVIDLTESFAKDMGIFYYQKLFQNKTKVTDYKILNNLAKGGFGEVFIATKIRNPTEVVALKRISKDMCKKNRNTTFYMTEKDIMTAFDTEWMVKAYECIQDDYYLYFIMEFIPGGDLLGYLSKTDTIGINEIKFYASEILVALDVLHSKGYCHRDLKPDNIFIGTDGHIKLGDFGSSGKITDGYCVSTMPIGTPDYVCKDVLENDEDGIAKYSTSIDLWTLGVIMYEMAAGVPPFYTESLKDTYRKIVEIDYERLEGGDPTLQDLLDKLLCDKDKRLTSEQIKEHPFFEGVNWADIKSTKPPFIPNVKNKEDISYFDQQSFKPVNSTIKGGYKDFVGFTHDPKYVRTFGESIMKNMFKDKKGDFMYQHTLSSTEIFNSQESLNTTEKELRAQIEQHELKIKQKEAELEELISSKMLEIDDLNCTIEDLTGEKEQKISEVNKQRSELQNITLNLTEKTDTLKLTADTLKTKEEQLSNLKIDIEQKLKLTLDQTEKSYLSDAVNDLKHSIERSKFKEKITDVKKSFYWFYKEYEQIKKELDLSKVTVEDASLSELKKSIRAYKTDVKDYQQRIEIENAARTQLEVENKRLLKLLKDNQAMTVVKSFKVKNALNNELVTIQLDQGIFVFNDIKVDKSMIYIRDLKNNEYHHFPYKKRALCVIVHFLKDFHGSHTSSKATHRKVKVVEEDLANEKMMLQGLEELELLITGNEAKDIRNQKAGSLKKIESLEIELKLARNSTQGEISDDDMNVVEFNNHMFVEHTVGKGTLCDHCGELMYGMMNQSYHCADCKLTVHKECYILVQTSCELQKAINKGRSVPVVVQNIEEKEKLLNMSI